MYFKYSLTIWHKTIITNSHSAFAALANHLKLQFRISPVSQNFLVSSTSKYIHNTAAYNTDTSPYNFPHPVIAGCPSRLWDGSTVRQVYPTRSVCCSTGQNPQNFGCRSWARCAPRTRSRFRRLRLCWLEN